ncbi:MAG: EF-hand domain-containing protein [Myxococcota bacterium]
MRTRGSNVLKKPDFTIELPPPGSLIHRAKVVLPPPDALKSLPPSNLNPIRQHITRMRESPHATTAVLLGLATLPAAVYTMVNPTPAAAETGRSLSLSASSTGIASDVLFGTPKTQLAAKDDHERELVTKIGALVQRDFGGDNRAAFNHYAGSDHQVSRDELSRLLSDAGIGNFLTRGSWVSGIMDRLDGPPNGDGNGKISWTEFNRVMSAQA